MMEISRNFKTGESDALDPALRDRILSSVTYSSQEPEVQPKRPVRRRSSPLLFVWGAAAAGILAGVFLRPLLLHEQQDSLRSSGPSMSDTAKSQAPANAMKSPGASGTASPNSVLPPASSPTTIAPSAGDKEKADSSPQAIEKITKEPLQQRESKQILLSPAPAGNAFDAANQKTVPQRFQNNGADSSPKQSDQHQADQYQGGMANDNAARSMSGTLDGNVTNQSEASSRQTTNQIQIQKPEAKKKAQLKARQTSNSKTNNVNINGPAKSSAPSSPRK